MPGTPAVPKFKAVEMNQDIEENTPFEATCRGDVGYPYGELQLVSNVSRLNDFVRVSEGCGD